jgi:hypothetical protein
MNRCLSLLAIGLLLVLPPHLRAEDGLIPMFNGYDLSGWVLTNTPAETWHFEQGMLICSGQPIGEIRTARMYQNFVMELEWRHMVPRGNAGVFVWADDITSRGVPFHRGIEVQVLENAYGNSQGHTTHGDIFPIHGASMTPINGRGGSRAFPTENRSQPSPEWNHYRIECVDGEISLAVNGAVVTRGKDCLPRKGYICLESEGGVVHYRNVRIRELPDSPIAPEQVAIADRGYRSLYNGLNLDGWEVSPVADLPRWNANDWILSFTGTGDQAGRLSSLEKFPGQVGFVVDVRCADPSASAVIRVGGAVRVDLREPSIASQLEEPGRWNRVEAALVNGQYVLKINGHPVPSDDAAPESDGPLTLEPTGGVEFCNLYVASGRDVP